jgi:predicted enzyme related to lactoylglutathione lyase
MGPDAFYTMFQLRGRNVGAAYKNDQPGVPPYWGTYVAVANIEEGMTQAKSLGGNVMVGPVDVGEHGRLAVITDPTGATFSVWQANLHQGVGVWGEVGAFCWSELLTRDTAAATRFYTALFGWTTKVSDMGGMAYTHWQNDGADIGGMMAIQANWGPMPTHWGNYVQVSNCDETAARASWLGGRVFMPPTDIPNTGRFAMIQDPQGAMFSVIALLPMQKG